VFKPHVAIISLLPVVGMMERVSDKSVTPFKPKASPSAADDQGTGEVPEQAASESAAFTGAQASKYVFKFVRAVCNAEFVK
jgi:hypothetical protein